MRQKPCGNCLLIIKDQNKYGYPTVKPLMVIKNIIRNSSREGDVILDPFIDSGTTAVIVLVYRCAPVHLKLPPYPV